MAVATLALVEAIAIVQAVAAAVILGTGIETVFAAIIPAKFVSIAQTVVNGGKVVVVIREAVLIVMGVVMKYAHLLFVVMGISVRRLSRQIVKTGAMSLAM
ncbi:hypothetical protein L6258_02775 [Candidatus Parcubacteria bacterium]|nr:hypothetical protein [Candidatus Parcubacteria bacterium]